VVISPDAWKLWLRKRRPPGFLEIGPRLVEGGGRAGRAFPWMAVRIETAPRLGIGRIARAHGDRATRAGRHLPILIRPTG
jgi:hypothetical protein